MRRHITIGLVLIGMIVIVVSSYLFGEYRADIRWEQKISSLGRLEQELMRFRTEYGRRPTKPEVNEAMKRAECTLLLERMDGDTLVMRGQVADGGSLYFAA